MRPTELVVRIPVASSRSVSENKKFLPKIKSKLRGVGKTHQDLVKKASIINTTSEQYNINVQNKVDKKLDFDDFDKLNVN